MDCLPFFYENAHLFYLVLIHFQLSVYPFCETSGASVIGLVLHASGWAHLNIKISVYPFLFLFFFKKKQFSQSCDSLDRLRN